MENVTGKNERAKALLKLLDKLAQQLPGKLSEEERTAQAMLQLDEQLGPEWKKEVESSGRKLPESSSSKEDMDKRHGTDCMYKKIKALLEENGESEKSIDEGRIPLEDEEDEEEGGSQVIIMLGSDVRR